MTSHRRRVTLTRLFFLLVVLMGAIWYLYRTFIHLPPAPAPHVTRAGLVVPFAAHT